MYKFISKVVKSENISKYILFKTVIFKNTLKCGDKVNILGAFHSTECLVSWYFCLCDTVTVKHLVRLPQAYSVCGGCLLALKVSLSNKMPLAPSFVATPNHTHSKSWYIEHETFASSSNGVWIHLYFIQTLYIAHSNPFCFTEILACNKLLNHKKQGY